MYEGCMPIEVMAGRGADTMRYGPLRPVGLRDPRTGHRPGPTYSCAPKTPPARCTISLVSDQFEMGRAEARFSMIPGLEHAEFIRYGVMHRNTFWKARRC